MPDSILATLSVRPALPLRRPQPELHLPRLREEHTGYSSERIAHYRQRQGHVRLLHRLPAERRRLPTRRHPDPPRHLRRPVRPPLPLLLGLLVSCAVVGACLGCCCP